jgi:hypothetical protein
MSQGHIRSWIKHHRFEILLVLGTLITHLYVALSPARSLLNWYNNDDAYYYFKVAQNICSGLGSTFDGINLTNGYHPLWMLICIPVFLLSSLDLILPLRVMVMLSALITGLTGVILFHLVSRWLSRNTAVFIAIFWVAYGGIHAVVTTGGMEAGISALFIVWLIYRVACVKHRDGQGWLRRNTMITGLIAALAILSRLDNIYLALIAGLWLMLEGEKGRTLLVLDIAVIPVILVGSYFLRLGTAEQFFFYAQSAYWYIAVLLVSKIIIYALMDLYSPLRWSLTTTVINLLLSLVLPAGISFGILTLLQGIGRISSFPRTVILIDTGLSLAWLLFSRFPAWLKSESSDPLPWVSKLNVKKHLAKFQLGLSYALPNAIILGIYVGFNRWMFGTFSPVSGQVKHWWSTLVNPIYGRLPSTFGGVIGLPVDGDSSWPLFTSIIRLISKQLAGWVGLMTKSGLVLMQLVVAGVLAALIILLLRKNMSYWAERVNGLGLIPLFAACLIQALYYGISGYLHTRMWYWVPSLVLGALVLAILVEALYIKITDKLGINFGKVLLAAGAIMVVFSLVNQFSRMYFYDTTNRSENPFILQARELEQATEPGSLIGTTGGGGLAYFIHGRSIVNLDGLMNSMQYFKRLQDGSADVLLDGIGLDYVYEKKYVVEESDPYRSFLPAHLQRITRIGGIPLYQYSPGRE